MPSFPFPNGRSITRIILPICWILFLCSCQASRLSSSNKTNGTIPGQLLPDGVDFFASGNTSSPWTLSMDFSKCYVFSKSNGTEIRTIAVKPSSNQQTGVLTYFPFKSDPYMSIVLTPGKCLSDDNKTNDYVVTIKLNDSTYSGCGNYVINKKLSGTWELIYIDNEPQFGLNYSNKIPTFTFDLRKNKISVQDGCNRRSSNMAIKGNQMRFEDFKDEQKPCENNTLAELMKNYMNGRSVEYYFREENLVFLLSNDTRIVFQKRQH